MPLNNIPPFVTVILPLYNDEGRIANCISSLLSQTYPSEFYELIVVNNNSTDQSAVVVKQFPVKLLHEKKIQSSYAARNRGIQHAQGEIFAFTDSDCTPVANWVSEGVKALLESRADLASGNVRFTFSPQKTGAEIFDSLTNMQIEQNIGERKVSKTANLFVRREVFDAIGQFPTVKSGGDVIWTGKATKKGYKLVYNPYAEVAHPARKLRALMKKQYRVGKGQTKIMAASGDFILKNLLTIIKQILPTRLVSVFMMVKRRRLHMTEVQAIRTSLAGYLCFMSNFIGNLAALPHLWRR